MEPPLIDFRLRGSDDLKEGWLAKHAVSDEDRLVTQQARGIENDGPVDPMQGLEGLDVAGPRPAA